MQELPAVMSDLRELREFDDPDTVYWIRDNTSQGAIFGGSMQLLTRVMLCTWPVTASQTILTPRTRSSGKEQRKYIIRSPAYICTT